MSEAAATSGAGGEGAFSTRTVIALLIAGVFAFCAFMVLSAYAPDLSSGQDGGAHALSKSAVGYAGMAQLLKNLGDPVVISRDPKLQAGSAGLLIVTPGLDVDKNALSALTVSAGEPILIVLPKWAVASDPANPGWVAKLAPYGAADVAKVLDQRFTGVTMVSENALGPVQLTGVPGGPLTSGSIDQLQAFTNDPDIFVRDAKGDGVVTKSHTEPVYILSDPDFLNTQGIKDLNTARVGVAIINMLRKGDGPIIFDVTLDGIARSRDPLKLAFEPPFLGATICVGAAALLLALQALARFGAPRPAGREIALGKRALADNSAGLIRMARREAHMAGRYLDLTRQAVARALGATRLGEADLTALLDRQAARAGASRRLSDLITEAEGVKDRAALMRLARDLDQWKTEMTGERR